MLAAEFSSRKFSAWIARWAGLVLGYMGTKLASLR